MNELGIALVWCSLQVTVVALVAACLYVVARRFFPLTGSLVPLTSLLVVVALSAMALSPWPRWADWTVAQVWENASSARGRRPTSVSENSTNAPSAVDEISVETLDVAPAHEVEEQPTTAALF